jgi:cysteine desulfurase
LPVPPQRAYLDHNATTPLHPAARAAMLAAFEQCGNASSIHREGRAARAVIETARAEIAAFVGASAANVVFTSGGTESLNLVLTPELDAASNKPFDVLLASEGEHAAVLSGHRFPAAAVELIGLTPEGVLDLEALDAALLRHSGRRIMLALQAANNETGVIQPVAAAAQRIKAAGGYLICDAVQAAGKIGCDLSKLGADALILSAHKLGGPQGVGAICFRSATPHIKDVLLRGGGQERGIRAGTENVAGIAGMAAAICVLSAGLEPEATRLASLRDRIEAEIAEVAADVVFFGQGAERLPNTSCFAIPGFEAQVLLMILDMEGVAVSSGSACSSGKVKSSHVLAAMGVEPNLAKGAVRVSLGRTSRPEDCLLLNGALKKTVRKMSGRRAKGTVETDQVPA